LSGGGLPLVGLDDVERPLDPHGHDRHAECYRDVERAFLERAQTTIARARALGRDPQAATLGDEGLRALELADRALQVLSVHEHPADLLHRLAEHRDARELDLADEADAAGEAADDTRRVEQRHMVRDKHAAAEPTHVLEASGDESELRDIEDLTR